MQVDVSRRSDELATLADELGFSSAGFCPAVEPTGLSRLHEWLERGYAGSMHYLPERAHAYRHPEHVLEHARSLMLLTMDYRTAEPTKPRPGEGRISRYAWGSHDYHDVIHPRLKQLVEKIKELVPGSQARGVIDTAPLLERDFAQLAGLGWIGKNTLLLNQTQGSLFFLAAIVTDAELAYDIDRSADHCGTCTACLDACPTDAFPQPYVLDATKCISYLTIELREDIPSSLREGIGDWIFGCDVCQDVCPWNHKAPQAELPEFQPTQAHDPLELLPLFELTDEEFRTRFRKTPMWRTKRKGLVRNAAIVLGNRRVRTAIPALTKALTDEEETIRSSAAWALGQIGGNAAEVALRGRLEKEGSMTVRLEIKTALGI